VVGMNIPIPKKTPHISQNRVTFFNPKKRSRDPGKSRLLSGGKNASGLSTAPATVGSAHLFQWAVD